MDPLDELKAARGSFRGPRPNVQTGSVPKYSGITVIYYCYAFLATVLVLVGFVMVLLGASSVAGHLGLGGFLEVVLLGGPFILGGCILYGIGEVFLAIRDIARNSWRR